MICIVVRVLVVEEQILQLDIQLLIVVVRMNQLCLDTKSQVLVTFGSTKSLAGGQCEGQKNATEMVISPGAAASFHVNTSTISLGADETYCFVVSVDGVVGEFCVPRKCITSLSISLQWYLD